MATSHGGVEWPPRAKNNEKKITRVRKFVAAHNYYGVSGAF